MLLNNSEINTLIAACMLTSSRYETEANESKDPYLSRATLIDEAAKYKALEYKLRDNFYETNLKGEVKAKVIKTINAL